MRLLIEKLCDDCVGKKFEKLLSEVNTGGYNHKYLYNLLNL